MNPPRPPAAVAPAKPAVERHAKPPLGPGAPEGRARRALHQARALAAHSHEFGRMIRKALRVLVRDGLPGVQSRIARLQSPGYRQQSAQNSGVPVDFFTAFAALANLPLRLLHRLGPRSTSGLLLMSLVRLWRGEILASHRLDPNDIRYHLDGPRSLLRLAGSRYRISGWAANLRAHKASRARVELDSHFQTLRPQLREEVQRALAPLAPVPLATGFSVTLDVPIGIHALRIHILDAAGSWVPIQRTLLLRMPWPGAFLHHPPATYGAWLRRDRMRLRREIHEIAQHISVMPDKPRFAIIVDARRPVAGLEDTLKSLKKQLYGYYDVFVITKAATRCNGGLPPPARPFIGTSLSNVVADFVILMRSGQTLSEDALYEFASALNRDPDADLVYADQDVGSPSGPRTAPFFKPDWSPDYLETFNYIGFTACYRTKISRPHFRLADPYDFVLRFTEQTANVVHVPKILGHDSDPGQITAIEHEETVSAETSALSARLKRTHRRGSVAEHHSHPGCYQVQLHPSRTPLVSVIVVPAIAGPADGGPSIHRTLTLVQQIRERSTYQKLEIIVVSRAPLARGQARSLREQNARRVFYPTRLPWSVAKMVNIGAREAQGKYLIIMHEEIEIITPSWIERLLDHFAKPHVGVVAPRLVDVAGNIAHAGLIHTSGSPEYVRRGFPGDEAGYFWSTCGARNYMAVSGDCMMTPASVFRRVGGWTEALVLSHCDADYCLKVRSLGLSVVYTGDCVLIETGAPSPLVAAGLDDDLWYQSRWGPDTITDPFYNDHFLTVAPPTFEPHINERAL